MTRRLIKLILLGLSVKIWASNLYSGVRLLLTLMFLLTPASLLILITITISSLLALTRSNWFMAWVAIEVNLLRFIPIITQSKSNQETEACVKYFLAQAVGSALILLSRLSAWSISPIQSWWTPILIIALLLKLGAAPCHFWYPSVITSISWSNALLLSTWQKLAPLALLSYPIIHHRKIVSLLAMAASLNALTGGILGINQSHLRTLLAYSSITHIGWILGAIYLNNPHLSITYFLFYSLIIAPIFILLHNINLTRPNQFPILLTSSKLSLFCLIILLLSLAGIPPLTGFLPKWLLISAMIAQIKIIILPLLIGSFINLYFYLNIVFRTLSPTLKIHYNHKLTDIKLVTLVLPATRTLGLIPIFLYAMTLLNKSQRYWHSILSIRTMNRYSWYRF